MIRSFTLWSGLLIAGFMVWAWRDGGRNFSYVEYSRPSATAGLFSGDGMVRAVWNTAAGAFLAPGLKWGREDFGHMGKDYELSVTRAGLMVDLEGPYREIRISAWMMFIPFFNIWIPLLAWSYLRRRKAKGLDED
jgi:hypothetical protein